MDGSRLADCPQIHRWGFRMTLILLGVMLGVYATRSHDCGRWSIPMAECRLEVVR
ncbi:MAG: hypothetical protein MH204_10240 [Fimbriimonadaceae bacterium]|nr:hypothetical protein [Fimbriimonadaceae bacterium]